MVSVKKPFFLNFPARLDDEIRRFHRSNGVSWKQFEPSEVTSADLATKTSARRIKTILPRRRRSLTQNEHHRKGLPLVCHRLTCFLIFGDVVISQCLPLYSVWQHCPCPVGGFILFHCPRRAAKRRNGRASINGHAHRSRDWTIKT